MNATPMAPRLGKYCKGYPLFRFREFPAWAENSRGNFADDHILYLQEDYTVTDGVYRNEHVVFDAVSVEWCMFCRERLNFRMPEAATLVPASGAAPG